MPSDTEEGSMPRPKVNVTRGGSAETSTKDGSDISCWSRCSLMSNSKLSAIKRMAESDNTCKTILNDKTRVL